MFPGPDPEGGSVGFCLVQSEELNNSQGYSIQGVYVLLSVVPTSALQLLPPLKVPTTVSEYTSVSTEPTTTLFAETKATS